MSDAPFATYRLQLHRDATLDHAASLAPYLARLGVSHVYTSPILQAAPGSPHGYDGVDPSRISADLGGDAAYGRFAAALQERGLQHLLDIVPNHMSTALPHNRWWWDVLERGRESPYAAHFDLNWERSGPDAHERLVLPVLGDHPAEVLARGELTLVRHGEGFALRYHEHLWPVAAHTLEPLQDEAPGRDLEAVMAHANADPEALGRLLDRQAYRLTYWRLERERLGYRRFFDLSTLMGVRVEDPQVFADTHRRVLALVAEGSVAGLRVDHVDGLRDPQDYLERLAGAAPGAWIVVEKILQGDERLREEWPTAGTTGYDFLNEVGALYVDPAGEQALSEVYAGFTGAVTEFPHVAREKKRQVLRELLGAEVQRLTDLLGALARRHRFDFTRQELAAAVEAVVAAFPVYRTYARADDTLHPADAAHVSAAVETARADNPELPEALIGFVARVLRRELDGEAGGEFLARFQQLTGAAMAKGVEDTAFYCFTRLIALNEVGGDPGRGGDAEAAFHEACAERQARWPLSLLATTTHDTKRGEDARLRIALLSEIPAAWEEAVRRWARINEPYRAGGYPDRNTEYLFYQTLVGSWPLSLERANRYLHKASREAKQYASWRNPDPEYDAALSAFVEAALGDPDFVEDLERFVEPLTRPARIASLSQTLIKMTAPGVPDIYQGAELWETRLVDPDNRSRVDFERRMQLLDRLEGATPEPVLEEMGAGLPKLWVIQQALRVRREHPAAFGPEGSYRPVRADGRRAGHLVAFSRGGTAIAVAPRLVLSLNGDWDDTALDLPSGNWRDAFTGERWGGRVAVGDLLRRFPVALLTATGRR